MGEKGRWRQEKGMVEPGGGEGEKRGRKGVRKGGREGGRASVCHSTVKAYFTQMTAYIQNVSAVCCSLHHIQLASAQQQLEQARIVQVGYTKPPCVRTALCQNHCIHTSLAPRPKAKTTGSQTVTHVQSPMTIKVNKTHSAL